jgi:transcriptional regulator with XRE-family HTH domain
MLGELSEKMSDIGRPIPPLGLHRIENGERRVDVDDLMALAVALKVSPVTLLMPDTSSKDAEVAVTGLPTYSAEQIWTWLLADDLGYYPVEYESLEAFFRRAWPQWLQERRGVWLEDIDRRHAEMREKTRRLLEQGGGEESRGDG